jgi:hypothetical protein
MKGLHDLWTNIELSSILWLLFLVYVVLLASNYNKNGSLKFQNGVAKGEECFTTKNEPSFFEVMHFHYAVRFKGRNVGLELDLKGHIKENDEIL